VTENWDEVIPDSAGAEHAAEATVAAVPGLVPWPMPAGLIAGVVVAVVLHLLVPRSSTLDSAVAWPTWPIWSLAVGLLLQLVVEWMSWGEVERHVNETVRAVQEAGLDVVSWHSKRLPWLAAATARCLDIRQPGAPTKVRELVVQEAVVYQAAFLETVRRRFWVRLTLALLLLSAGVWAGLYRLRSDTNLSSLREVAGAALVAAVLAMAVAGVSILTGARAERALQAWRDQVLSASYTLTAAQGTTAVNQGGPETAVTAEQEEQPIAGHNEQAQQDKELEKLLGI
jgi:hypothetical protein